LLNQTSQKGPNIAFCLTGRPKRRRAAPQRFTGKEDPELKKTLENEEIEEEN